MTRPSRLVPLILLWALAGPPSAAARSLHVRDEGHLHYVRSSGSQIIDEGPAKGDLPGSVRVHFTYTGAPTVTATFTILGHGWSISGRATGRLSNPYTLTPSFRGKLTITGGSGRYRGASGNGELFGVYYRRTYALTVQTIGTLHY
jgi:hypothetical protein